MPATKLLAVLVAASAAACTGTPEIPGTLVVAIESMPQNLDPRFSTDAGSARIGGLVFRALTRFDRNHQAVPDLAVDWRRVDDRTIEFDLRRDARFADGASLTSADVRATYESILDPDTGSPKRESLAFLDRIGTPDRWTVRFHMREPYAAFLTACSIGILPEDLSLEGAGPYRITKIEPDHEIRLESVGERGGIPTLRFRVIPDDTTRALELKNGSVDLVQNGIEPENLPWLEADPRLCIQRSPGTTFQYVGINLKDPVLSRLPVRRALAHAIDRNALIEHLLRGTARPANGLLAPVHWAHLADLPAHPYDPDRARRLLEEAGLSDPDGAGPEMRHRFSYKTTNLASRRRLAEALQAMLARVGIGLDIETYEWGTFYGDIRRGSFELYGLAWVGIVDPDFFHTLLASDMTPPQGNNRGFFSHPEVDRLTRLGRRTWDPAERVRLYAGVQRIVARRLPFLPLWWEDVVTVQDRRLCGFRPTPDGDLDSLAKAWWSGGTERRPGGPCGCGTTG